jgi:hypothetical protein
MDHHDARNHHTQTSRPATNRDPHPLPPKLQYGPPLIEKLRRVEPGMRWSDLDRLLVQLWKAYSIHPKVVCPRSRNISKRVKDWARYLLPETAERGTVELVEGLGWDDWDTAPRKQISVWTAVTVHSASNRRGLSIEWQSRWKRKRIA